MLSGLESRTEPAALTVNRIGRRVIMCMRLIAALATIWNLLGP
jgi:hypothetical protein